MLERDLDPDPFVQFARWLAEAETAGIPLANAVTLATATREGRPSARNVLLRDFDERGFVFYTNYRSRKALELSENPNASLVFLWKELDRQVCVTGSVERTSREESERYFRTRPREARLGAWASPQSEVIGSRAELDERFQEMATTYPGDDVPLPPFWGGYRLKPDTIEFWQSRLHRLHDRLRYSRRSDGVWVIERLSP
jgi:pyridoxamine 5'-phosphate oxidase